MHANVVVALSRNDRDSAKTTTDNGTDDINNDDNDDDDNLTTTTQTATCHLRAHRLVPTALPRRLT